MPVPIHFAFKAWRRASLHISFQTFQARLCQHDLPARRGLVQAQLCACATKFFLRKTWRKAEKAFHRGNLLLALASSIAANIIKADVQDCFKTEHVLHHHCMSWYTRAKLRVNDTWGSYIAKLHTKATWQGFMARLHCIHSKATWQGPADACKSATFT